MVHTIRVQHRNEHDSRPKSLLDLAIGVLLVAVGQADAVLVRIEQVRDEVDQVVRSTALTCVNS